jgi:rare lipoprotein A (peptidoglycan hydrolase)
MQNRVLAAALATALVFLAGAAQAKTKKEVRWHFRAVEMEAPPPIAFDLEIENEPDLIGLVSWYGPGFHGRRTASGERYNMHAMTCASRSLPFGTMLELTNLSNGEKAVVRVNDRGPFYRHRILDLSLAAAKKLGFHRKGQTKVAVREISIDTEGPSR